ncbi:hypothetical protein H9Q69_009720 [Fusarium xylarioides]|nr:hypothetical protein H9Q69_009720 [Fusarium xylarioides]
MIKNIRHKFRKRASVASQQPSDAHESTSVSAEDSTRHASAIRPEASETRDNTESSAFAPLQGMSGIGGTDDHTLEAPSHQDHPHVFASPERASRSQSSTHHIADEQDSVVGVSLGKGAPLEEMSESPVHPTTMSRAERLWAIAYDDLREESPELLAFLDFTIFNYLSTGLGPMTTSRRTSHARMGDGGDSGRFMEHYLDGFLKEDRDAEEGLERISDDSENRPTITEEMDAAGRRARNQLRETIHKSKYLTIPWTLSCLSFEGISTYRLGLYRPYLNPELDLMSSSEGIIHLLTKMEWYIGLSQLRFGHDTDTEDLSSNSFDRNTQSGALIELYKAVMSYQIYFICGHLRATQGSPVAVDDTKLQALAEKIGKREEALATWDSQKLKKNLDKFSSLSRLPIELAGSSSASYEKSPESDIDDIDDLLQRLDASHQSSQTLDARHVAAAESLGEWVCESKQYRAWEEGSGDRVFWLTGDPGTGKSRLLHAISQRLGEKSPAAGLNTFRWVAYVSCDSTRSRQASALSIIKGLIHQILIDQPSLSQALRVKFKSTLRKSFNNPEDLYAMSTVFYSLLENDNFQPTYIVLDGIEKLSPPYCVPSPKCAELNMLEETAISDLIDIIATTANSSDKIRWIVSVDSQMYRSLLSTKAPTRSHFTIDSGIEKVKQAAFQTSVSQLEGLAKERGFNSYLCRLIKAKIENMPHVNNLWLRMVFNILKRSSMPWNGPLIFEELQRSAPSVEALYHRRISKIKILETEDRKYCIDMLLAASVSYEPLLDVEMVAVIGLPAHIDLETLITSLLPEFLEILEEESSNGRLIDGKFSAQKSDQMVEVSGFSWNVTGDFGNDCKTRPQPYEQGQSIPGPSPRGCAFSPDARLVATCSDERQLKLWDVVTGKLQHVFEGFKGYVESVSISHSSPDGVPLLVAFEDSTIWIWELTTLKEVQVLRGLDEAAGKKDVILIEHNGSEDSEVDPLENPVETAAGGSDDAKESEEGEDPEEDDDESISEAGSDFSVGSIAIAKGGEKLAAATSCGLIVWDIPNFRSTIWKDEEGEDYTGIRRLAFSPDGSLLAASVRSKIVLLDIINGKTWGWLPDLDTASADSASTNGIEDTEQPQIQSHNDHNAEPLGHTENIDGLEFSPDSLYLASGSDDSTARIWDITQRKSVAVMRYHKSHVNSVSFSADGSSLAVGSTDTQISIWNEESFGGWGCGETKTNPDGVLQGHKSFIWSVAFSRCNDLLASTDSAGVLRIWNTNRCAHRKGTSAIQLGGRGHTSEVVQITVSPDGKTIASGCDRGVICFWSGESGNRSCTLEEGHSYGVISLSFSNDGTTLVSTGRDYKAVVWHVDGTHSRLRETLEGHTDWVRGAAVSNNGELVATASDDRTVRLWDISQRGDKKPVRVFSGHSDYVFSVAFSLDDSLLASAGDDRHVCVWDLNVAGDKDSPERRMRDDKVDSCIHGLIFSPDGKTILSTSTDSTVGLWSLRPLDEEQCILAMQSSLEASNKIWWTFKSMRIDKNHPEVLLTEFGFWPFDISVPVAEEKSGEMRTSLPPLELSNKSPWGFDLTKNAVTWNKVPRIHLPEGLQASNGSFWVHDRSVVVGCKSGDVLLFRFSPGDNWPELERG